MRTFVINLAEATARRAHMETVLGAAGIAFERFDAIDGDLARRHPDFDRIPRMLARQWTPGELGCLLSHYEIWRAIAAGPDAFGGILEDDLFVDGRLRQVLSNESAIPSDADLIKLEAIGQPAIVSRRVVPHPAGLVFRRLHSRLHGTGAYVISRRTATFLVQSITAFNMPVDDVLFSPYHRIGGGLRIYQAVPALAIQSNMLPDTATRPDLKSRLEMERFASRFLNDRQKSEPPPPAPHPKAWQIIKAAPARTLRRWQEKAFRQLIRIEFGGTP